ncbi:hypothetical protein ACRAWC_25350 [Leifsonia sp. L25]
MLALGCIALPFLVGFGIARLSGRALIVMATIVVLFIIAVVVLGQMFAF